MGFRYPSHSNSRPVRLRNIANCSSVAQPIRQSCPSKIETGVAKSGVLLVEQGHEATQDIGIDPPLFDFRGPPKGTPAQRKLQPGGPLPPIEGVVCPFQREYRSSQRGHAVRHVSHNRPDPRRTQRAYARRLSDNGRHGGSGDSVPKIVSNNLKGEVS